MINTMTFEFKDNEDEIATINEAIQLIGEQRYKDALELLVQRHDKLVEKPQLKQYGL